jgi:hypothetical protein
MPATFLLLLRLRMLLPSPLLAHYLCCCSHHFLHHRQRHRRLIAVSKRWSMATAPAMARLKTTSLGDCGGGSSDEDGCRNSRGRDFGKGGNGVGDDPPCHPCHFPLHHPPRLCQWHPLCCRHCNCICQHARKRAIARAARAMATANKRAMEMVARAMAT